MTWELCDGSSENLVDMWGGCDEKTSWQKARRHFIDQGYEGRYLLIAKDYAGAHFSWFRMYQVNLRMKNIPYNERQDKERRLTGIGRLEEEYGKGKEGKGNGKGYSE